MTLSAERSPVLRGANLDELPLATLIAIDQRAMDHEIDDVLDSAEEVDEGPTTEELVSQAYQAGFDEGAAAAEAAIRSTFASTLSALEASAQDLAMARTVWENAGPVQLIDIALEVAEMVIMREVTTAADPGRDAIVRCLTEVERHESAVIRLNPGDLAQLEPFDDLLVDRSFELVADPAIVSGDAVADTTNGSVDARLRGAIGRVREELLR